MNKENIRNKNIGRRNEINTNCKKKIINNNINKKSCMLILNKYPKRMQPKQAKTKKKQNMKLKFMKAKEQNP